MVSASGVVDAGLVDVVVYSGPTATAVVEWLGHAKAGNGYVGDKIEVMIYPEDAYGNRIDYHVFPRDGLGVAVDVNAVGTDVFTLTRLTDTSRPGPATTTSTASTCPPRLASTRSPCTSTRRTERTRRLGSRRRWT